MTNTDIHDIELLAEIGAALRLGRGTPEALLLPHPTIGTLPPSTQHRVHASRMSLVCLASIAIKLTKCVNADSLLKNLLTAAKIRQIDNC